jgi:DnaJ-class molecular chaperone
MSNNDGRLNPNNIFEIAQQIAKNMPPPGEGENIDLPNMVKYVTQSVSQMMGTGDVDFTGIVKSFEQLQSPSAPVRNQELINPKDIKLIDPKDIERGDKHFEELNDDSDADEFRPRTKDLHFTLNVDLEDFYKGKTKKLAIHRKRIQKDAAGKTKVVEEKKKIAINIEPGMRDDQVIRFNKEADELPGYETGDIVITLCENPHGYFEREGDNLFIVKKVSLYEALAVTCGRDIDLNIKHLDGSFLSLKTNKKALHSNEGIRKIKGEGMPYYKKEGFGDLFVRFNLIIPDSIDKSKIDMLREIFPGYNDSVTDRSTARNCTLEDVTEADMEALDYDYSSEDDESEYSEESEESYEEPKRGEKRLPHAVEKIAGRRKVR